MIVIWHTSRLLELLFCRKLSKKLLLWLSYYLWRKWQKNTRELERAYREIDENFEEFVKRPDVQKKLEKLKEDCDTRWIIHLNDNEQSVIDRIMRQENDSH